MVSFKGGFKILFVYPYWNPHKQVLWPFNDIPVHAKQVRLLQSFKSEEIVSKVHLMVDLFLNLILD